MIGQTQQLSRYECPSSRHRHVPLHRYRGKHEAVGGVSGCDARGPPGPRQDTQRAHPPARRVRLQDRGRRVLRGLFLVCRRGCRGSRWPARPCRLAVESPRRHPRQDGHPHRRGRLPGRGLLRPHGEQRGAAVERVPRRADSALRRRRDHRLVVSAHGLGAASPRASPPQGPVLRHGGVPARAPGAAVQPSSDRHAEHATEQPHAAADCHHRAREGAPGDRRVDRGREMPPRDPDRPRRSGEVTDRAADCGGSHRPVSGRRLFRGPLALHRHDHGRTRRRENLRHRRILLRGLFPLRVPDKDPGAEEPPARAGQLRAGASRCALRLGPPGRVPGCDGSGHEPRAAASPGGKRVPGPSPQPARTGQADHAGGAHAVRGGTSVRRAVGGGEAGFSRDERERTGRGRDLRPARRTAPRHRARGGAGQVLPAGEAPRAADLPVGAPEGGRSGPSLEAAGAQEHRRLEPRPAGSGRAHRLSAGGGVSGGMHGGSGGERRARRRRGARRRREADLPRGQEPPQADGDRGGAEVPHARDGARVRPGAPGGKRRGRRRAEPLRRVGLRIRRERLARIPRAERAPSALAPEGGAEQHPGGPAPVPSSGRPRPGPASIRGHGVVLVPEAALR